MPFVEWLLIAIGIYLALGLVIGGAWLARTAAGRDPALRGSSKSVRILLLPGAVALWPALLLAGRKGDAG